MKKSLLVLTCALAMSISYASAQTSTSTTSTTAASDGSSTTTQTTTTDASGTITEFDPGSTLVLSSGSGSPTHYKFSKSVTYVTPDGKVIQASKVRKDAKVRVHYSHEGGDMVVDKVTVLNEDKD